MRGLAMKKVKVIDEEIENEKEKESEREICI